MICTILTYDQTTDNIHVRTLAFTIIFSTFLVGCVNYSEIPNHHKLSEVLEPQCISKQVLI
jgi:hypothetical protein